MESGGTLTEGVDGGLGVHGPGARIGWEGIRWVRVKCSATLRVLSLLPSSTSRISQPRGFVEVDEVAFLDFRLRTGVVPLGLGEPFSGDLVEVVP